MKLIHISDLHIGKRLNDYSLIEDQRFILNQIVSIIDEVKSEGVIIAGDVYDKSVPSTEAVELFDEFLVKLNKHNQKVYIISGNHDSAERLAFGNKFLSNNDIHISPVYNGKVTPIVESDDNGELNIYLLPFIKPTSVKRFFPEEDINSYTDALDVAIKKMEIDSSKRNILVTHQFVTGASVSDSEEISVGGSDNVDSRVFESFDYVALGHIHGPQIIDGNENIRYCGTPLKYSFSEASHKKSVTVLDFGKKGEINKSFVELKPLHDLVVLKEKYETFMTRSFYENTTYPNDYLSIVLTDENDVMDAFAKLRNVYPYLMHISYENKRTMSNNDIELASDIENKSEFDLFRELFMAQNNSDFSEEAKEYLERIIDEIKEESL